MVESKTGRKVRMAKMSIEVRLLNIAGLCFITAQYVVRAHPSDHGFWMLGQGFRIAALLTFIAAQVIGFRTRKAWEEMVMERAMRVLQWLATVALVMAGLVLLVKPLGA